MKFNIRLSGSAMCKVHYTFYHFEVKKFLFMKIN